MSEVLTQAQDGVLIITINRPEAKNAVNQAVAQGVAARCGAAGDRHGRGRGWAAHAAEAKGAALSHHGARCGA